MGRQGVNEACAKAGIGGRGGGLGGWGGEGGQGRGKEIRFTQWCSFLLLFFILILIVFQNSYKTSTIYMPHTH